MPATPLVDSAWWTRNSVKAASAGVVTMNDGSSQFSSSVIEADSSTYRWSTTASMSVDVSVTGQADTFDLGMLAGSVASTYLGAGVADNSTFYGISFNIFANQLNFIAAGVVVRSISDANLRTADANTYATWTVQYVYQGSSLMMTALCNGVVRGSWAVTAPVDGPTRLAMGQRSGLFSQVIKVQNAAAQLVVLDTFGAISASGRSSITFDNTSYTSDAGEPSGGGANSAWLTFTVPTTGRYVFDTVGSATDTLLSVYSGSALASLTLLARDDNSGGGLTSKLALWLEAGRTVQVQIGLASGAGGSTKINVGLDSAYYRTVKADIPQLFWPLDDPAGAGQALDASGNGKSGGPTGTTPPPLNFAQRPRAATGVFGSAFGSGTANLTSPTLTLPSTGMVSVEVFCSLEQALNFVLWSFPGAASTLGLLVNNNNVAGTMGLSNGSSTHYIPVPSQGFHHIVWVVPVAASTAGMKVYIDGVLYAGAFSGTAFTTPSLANAAFRLDGWTFDGNQQWKGAVEVSATAVYASELTAAQVSAHYKALVGQLANASVDADFVVVPATATVDTTAFTTEAGEPLTLPANRTAWAKFIPRVNGSYTFDTVGSNFDTGLALYSGQTMASLTLVASDDNSGGGTTSRLTAVLTAGTQYWLQYGSVAGASPDGGSLVVSLTGTPTAKQQSEVPFSAGAKPTFLGFLAKGRSSYANDSLAGG